MGRGFSRGVMNERTVVSAAVQDAVVVLVPAVGVHVTPPDSAPEPFLNCTVPVGPAA